MFLTRTSFKNIPLLFLLLITCVVAAFLPPTTLAQNTKPADLWVTKTTDKDAVAFHPQRFPNGYYLPRSEADRLLNMLDPFASPLWNRISGEYQATVSKQDIRLYQKQNTIQFGKDTLTTARPLLVDQAGVVYLPLCSVYAILGRFPAVKANFEIDFPTEIPARAAVATPRPALTPAVTAPAVATPTPSSDALLPPDLPVATQPTPTSAVTPFPTATPLIPTPTPVVTPLATPASTPIVITATPTPNITPPPILPTQSEETKAANINVLLEDAKKGSNNANITKSQLQNNLSSAAQYLQARHTIVIDTEALPVTYDALKAPDLLSTKKNGSQKTDDTLPLNPRTGADTNLPADLTFKIAQRCQEILASNDSIQIVLTRGQSDESTTPAQRLERIKQAQAKALVCLRIDQSPHASLSGYRIFTVHTAVDPQGLTYASRSGSPDSFPSEAQYVPFQNMSLALARLVDAELTRGGFPAAKDKFKIAPLFYPKRACMPSITLSLGYSTSSDDLSRLQDTKFVQESAASLAQSLINFDRWLKENGWEARS
ncbi:TPA: hypothetical protein DDW35_11660 [Candidatus Sumerlaeota bacterium]|nr:hypothetical protein [Candidatus Sumerlaeota bacterium]